MKHDIYFIAPFPPPMTGAAAMAEELADAISEIGQCTVNRLNISMTQLSGSAGQYLRKVMTLLGAAIHVLIVKHDILVINPPGGLMLAFYFPLMAVARLRGVRIIFDHHNYSYINAPTRLMGMAARLMGDRGLHLFLSEKMGRQFSDIYYVSRWEASSNWGRLSFEPNDQAIERAFPLTLGFLSNVTLDKGIDTFVALVEDAMANGASVRAVVGGGLDAHSRPLIEEARRRGLPIEVPGPLYGPAKADFFAHCDMLVLPTRYRNEAEPLVLIEGQLAGCYILATDVGTISETVCPGSGAVWPASAFPEQALQCVLAHAAALETLRQQRAVIASASAQRARDSRLDWAKCVAGLIG